MDTVLTRGAAMTALAAGTAATLLPVAAAATIPVSDEKWAAPASDFKAKLAYENAAWAAEDEASQAFGKARSAHLPEPQAPGSGLPADITSMTLAQIKATSEQPAYKAAWAEYERDHVAWKQSHDALRANVVEPFSAAAQAAYEATAGARDALISYRVRSLADLHEKMAIVAKDYDGCEIPQEFLAAFMADVLHLAREA